MTVDEAAARSTLHRETIVRALKTGKLKGHKMQKKHKPQWVIYRDDLEEYIESLSVWRSKPKI